MSGLSLADTQHRLKDYLLDASNDQTAVLPLIAAGYGLPREKRLDIYHNAYRARLIEALETVYERTWSYLGDQSFYDLTSRFIEENPSSERNLRNYGADFPAFLRQALPEDPEVGELADMDWHLHIAFDAPDAPCLAAAALGDLSEADWECAGFRFQPGLSLAVYAWNTVEIWHAIDQGQVPPAARRLEQRLAHVFWRQAQKSNFRSLQPPEHLMLDALLRGKSFAETCEQLNTEHPAAAELAGPWLYRWLSDEMISEITLSTD
jgi:hypothetical protein